MLLASSAALSLGFVVSPLSHGKLISNFMLISSFHKKISSVKSQLSIEKNFEILFRNLEHVLFCEILWSTVIGQSAVFTSGFRKFIFSVKSVLI